MHKAEVRGAESGERGQAAVQYLYIHVHNIYALYTIVCVCHLDPPCFATMKRACTCPRRRDLALRTLIVSTHEYPMPGEGHREKAESEVGARLKGGGSGRAGQAEGDRKSVV